MLCLLFEPCDRRNAAFFSLPLTIHILPAIVATLEKKYQHDTVLALAVAWKAFLRASKVPTLPLHGFTLPGDLLLKSLGPTVAAGVGISDAM